MFINLIAQRLDYDGLEAVPTTKLLQFLARRDIP